MKVYIQPGSSTYNNANESIATVDKEDPRYHSLINLGFVIELERNNFIHFNNELPINVVDANELADISKNFGFVIQIYNDMGYILI